MQMKYVLAAVVIVCGVIWLLVNRGGNGDFDELSTTELGNISAYMKSGKASNDANGMFQGELLPSWDELTYSEKVQEAEQIEKTLRSGGVSMATIRVGKRTVLVIRPNGRQLHEFPLGVPPKAKKNRGLPDAPLAPNSEEP